MLGSLVYVARLMLADVWFKVSGRPDHSCEQPTFFVLSMWAHAFGGAAE
jgi:hypothetical protein